MTIDIDDAQNDDFRGSLARLRTYDISPRRSRQLRRRCYAVLQAEPLSKMADRAPFPRIVIPALASAWCLAYLVEIVRRIATAYRYFGTQ
jgi:hypothetical protein